MQDNFQSSSYKQLEQKSKYTNMFLRWFLYFVLILFASYFIFPLYVMVVTSLKTMEEIRQGTLLTWPSSLNFDSWLVAWGGRGYGAGDTFLRPYFWNSIKMVVPAVFFFKQKTAYEIGVRLVGSEMCIRDRRRLLFIKVK